MNNTAFSSEQKQYLEGFFTALKQRGGMAFLGQTEAGQFTGTPEQAVTENVFGTPLDDLCKEELIKHEQNGLDVWDTLLRNARAEEFPSAPDAFRYKFYGLFHVKPVQDSFMLRCRIPGGQLRSHQVRGLAEIAEDWGGGYAHVTTRNNLQIREIRPADTIKTLIKLDELGLTSKGSGADNVRNITATPTTGFDAQEYLDVLPLAKSMHHYILNHRDLYGMPRKFNIAFDSAGTVSACADTNDIGFYAVRVEEGTIDGVAAGIYFRVQLCGITGHKQFASDCGLLVQLHEAIPVAAAMLRVFIQNGCRTNRNKARLKYLIDDWGVAKFLDETQKRLAFPLVQAPVEKMASRPLVSQDAHIGIHPTNDPDFSYVGPAVPVGRLTPSQMHAVADLSEQYGRGEIRLTAWQNFLIPHVRNEDTGALAAQLAEVGLKVNPSVFEAGLVACTGNQGCKYAATATKVHAVELAAFLTKRFDLETPINIHLTGCPNSCAQHYIGDIGLLGAKCKRGDQTVEGYHVFFGGGVEHQQAIGVQVWKSVPFDELKPLLESALRVYVNLCRAGETFGAFTRRHSPSHLQSLFGPLAAAA